MTADWAKLPYDVLGKISSRIVNEVAGRQPGRLRHQLEAAGHDRVGMRVLTAALTDGPSNASRDAVGFGRWPKRPSRPTAASAAICPWCSAAVTAGAVDLPVLRRDPRSPRTHPSCPA